MIYPSELSVFFFFSFVSCQSCTTLVGPGGCQVMITPWGTRSLSLSLSLFFLGHFKDLVMWNVGVEILGYIVS